MKKRLEHNGQIATISLDLNYTITEEKTLHRVIVSGFNCTYDLMTFIDSKDSLEDELMKFEEDFMNWVEDNPIAPTPDEAILQSLGYTKE